MNPSTPLKSIAPGVWTLSYPLKMLGVDLQRNVTLLQLSSGKLVIHSTGPFSKADVKAIHELGKPVWMVDVLLRHDTFTKEGHQAFPDALYLAPPGFETPDGIAVGSLVPAPAEWADEIEVIAIDGAPSFSEIVVFHRQSRTLVVGDLLFNFSGKVGLFQKILLTLGAVGGNYRPGMTRPFKSAIKDQAAFARSVRRVLEWDFDRVIVGHGDPIFSGGKEALRRTLEAAGIRVA